MSDRDPLTLTELPRPPRVPSGVEPFPLPLDEEPREAETQPAESIHERILAEVLGFRADVAALRSDVRDARAAVDRVAEKMDEGLAILRSEERVSLVAKVNAMTNLESNIEALRDSATKDAEALRSNVADLTKKLDGVDVRVRHVELTCFPPPPPEAEPPPTEAHPAAAE